MHCSICFAENLVNLLDKDPIEIWSGAGDSSKVSSLPKFRCTLYQCRKCGHVQQPMTKALDKFLSAIYNSPFAQVSTEIGIGNWGGRRGHFIEGVLKTLPLHNTSSALEIGSAGGYVLRYLKRQGFRDVTGVDPSLGKNRYVEEGIHYIQDIVRAEMNLQKKFDLVVSFCAFEHIGNIRDVFLFIRNHLADDGVLFFEVPYVLEQLATGDPAVFLHEHIHYFTYSALHVLLESSGFSLCEAKVIGDSLFVLAKKKNDDAVSAYETTPYIHYEKRVDGVIQRVAKRVRHTELAFHGACNALHNILKWGKINKDFGLFDNDDTKIGKKFFGKEVCVPTKELISHFSYIFVVPSVYAKEIIKQYYSLGFKGVIEPVMHSV